MKKFLDNNFLLSNQTAVNLYHDFVKNLPIIDYHCHINPEEIANDKCFSNITEIWLGGDHYKWRLMRAAGIEEQYITGNASPYDKFIKWVETLSKAIGNPLYHWSHLELQRYFDYYEPVTLKTADKVWELCNEKLKAPGMSARSIIKSSNVEVICTTDDPIDTLEWHKKIADDEDFNVKVLPTWRPDNAMYIEKDSFLTYLDQLAEKSKVEINSFKDLKTALSKRLDYFNSHGCVISDHGVEYVYFNPGTDDEVEKIFTKRKQNEKLTPDEETKFKTAFMLYSGRECHERGMAMQLHYGCKRENNTLAFKKMGANTGFDAINDYTPAAEIADFLNALNNEGRLPKTILYSLNPNDNQVIDTIAACFQCSEAVSKIQHGAAWWFNDHKTGMSDHLISLGNHGYLAGFVGMLTDSRSFLSYTRHEYFRRILCNYLGCLVENGEFPENIEILSEIAKSISYQNALKYFKFK